MIQRFYPFPLRAWGMNRRDAPFAHTPRAIRSFHPYLLRVHPIGLTTEETRRVLHAATVHRALAVDTIKGLLLPEQFQQLTFQDLEGASMMFMEWNRFSPECSLHLVRSRITSCHVDAAIELLLLRNPWVRVILHLTKQGMHFTDV